MKIEIQLVAYRTAFDPAGDPDEPRWVVLEPASQCQARAPTLGQAVRDCLLELANGWSDA